MRELRFGDMIPEKDGSFSLRLKREEEGLVVYDRMRYLTASLDSSTNPVHIALAGYPIAIRRAMAEYSKNPQFIVVHFANK